jgi:ferredoxin-like protein FixX
MGKIQKLFYNGPTGRRGPTSDDRDELVLKINEIIDYLNKEDDRDDSEVEVSEEERCEFMSKELVSNCCGAEVDSLNADNIGICSECGEGCGAVEVYTEDLNNSLLEDLKEERGDNE